MKITTEQTRNIHFDQTIPEQEMDVPVSAHSDLQAFQDNPPQLHKDVLGQEETSFRADSWLHCGLND
jgi:hypothetical protein